MVEHSIATPEMVEADVLYVLILITLNALQLTPMNVKFYVKFKLSNAVPCREFVCLVVEHSTPLVREVLIDSRTEDSGTVRANVHGHSCLKFVED